MGDSTKVLNSPYKTIQAAINHFEQPISAEDYQRKIIIKVIDPGIYTESLIIPNRSITIYGPGVTINGNITREVSAVSKILLKLLNVL